MSSKKDAARVRVDYPLDDDCDVGIDDVELPVQSDKERRTG